MSGLQLLIWFVCSAGIFTWGYLLGRSFGYEDGYSACWWDARSYCCHVCRGRVVDTDAVVVVHAQGNAYYHPACEPDSASEELL
jgi:hypothetical protein